MLTIIAYFILLISWLKMFVQLSQFVLLWPTPLQIVNFLFSNIVGFKLVNSKEGHSAKLLQFSLSRSSANSFLHFLRPYSPLIQLVDVTRKMDVLVKRNEGV